MYNQHRRQWWSQFPLPLSQASHAKQGECYLKLRLKNFLTTSEANQLDHDPFASDSDEEETEKNEALVKEEDEEEADESESEDDA